jgi:hypothetical protein
MNARPVLNGVGSVVMLLTFNSMNYYSGQNATGYGKRPLHSLAIRKYSNNFLERG